MTVPCCCCGSYSLSYVGINDCSCYCNYTGQHQGSAYTDAEGHRLAQLTACWPSAPFLVAGRNLVIVLTFLSALSDVAGLLAPL